MQLHPNDWNGIRAFYRKWSPEIMGAPRNEWGIPAYLWDEKPIINFTPIEYWLWSDIRECSAVLYPQYPVGRYFVDFGNPIAKVAVECDGAEYHQDKEKDEARDAELGAMGWMVYRISGSDCAKESDEETGNPSYPHLFIRNICEAHGIGRNSRRSSDAWFHLAEMLGGKTPRMAA